MYSIAIAVRAQGDCAQQFLLLLKFGRNLSIDLCNQSQNVNGNYKKERHGLTATTISSSYDRLSFMLS